MDLAIHLDTVWRIMLAIVAGLVALPLAGWLGRRATRLMAQRAEAAGFDRTVLSFLAGAIRVGLLIGALLAILILAGVEVSSIAAVLGAATLAVGLALQGTLSNVASGVVVVSLRLFKVGDFIAVGAHKGTVRALGLFTTELKTVQGLIVIVPNAELLKAPIVNHSGSDAHRVDLDVRLHWDGDVAAAIAAVRAAIAPDSRILAGPALEVTVTGLNEAGPVLSVRAWCRRADSLALGWSLAAETHRALRAAGIRPADPPA